MAFNTFGTFVDCHPCVSFAPPVNLLSLPYSCSPNCFFSNNTFPLFSPETMVFPFFFWAAEDFLLFLDSAGRSTLGGRARPPRGQDLIVLVDHFCLPARGCVFRSSCRHLAHPSHPPPMSSYRDCLTTFQLLFFVRFLCEVKHISSFSSPSYPPSLSSFITRYRSFLYPHSYFVSG